MSATPFDHPILSAWAADPATAAALSWDAEARALRRFWTALAGACGTAGVLDAEVAARLEAAVDAVAFPHADSLRDGMRRDGVVVPGLVAALRARLPEDLRAALHHGSTSQDALDTASMMRMRDVLRDLAARADALGADLARFDAGAPLMAVTRLRDALPIAAGDRIGAWRRGLADAAARAAAAAARCPVQCGGPVGDGRGYGGAVGAVRADLARRLGLRDPSHAWHAERGPVEECAGALAALARACGKMGFDVGLMAQDPVGAAVLRGGGGSSAMAHKVNPVDAELCTALARHAGVLLGAVAGAGPHEMERSGIGWTQEWLALPQLAACAGGAVAAAERLVAGVERLGG